MRMPEFLKLNDARKYKNEYLASLTEAQVEILDTAAHGRVYGSAPGTSPTDAIILTRKGVEKVVEGGQAVLDRLVRMGWLRFASMPSKGGYFWHTQGTERLWEVLGR